ncbi:MAG: hypothetical protein ACLQB4_09105 [Beijerinckiaceae bacterium]
MARQFGMDWLTAEGDNPLQKLWKCRDALATNELLNFGDAIENFEKVDTDWLAEQIDKVKNGDEGNRAGAIFELLGLNVFLFAGNTVIPSKSSNPGYDGIVELPNQSSLLVSIKNHGMTSHERFFQKNATELDKQFQSWLQRHSAPGTELRVNTDKHLDSAAWVDVKTDVKNILDGQLSGTARQYIPKGKAQIILKDISSEYHPLGRRNISSITFIAAKAHKNEQDKFLEDIRKGCSNLVKHTKSKPDSACPVLFVRLCAGASVKNCKDWADDYFKEYPKERVGLIILYQAAVVNSKESTSLTHYVLPIMGPQYTKWANPPNLPARRLPNMGVLVGVIIHEASRKVILADGGQQIEMDGMYSYQRGDIYRFYRMEGGSIQANLSNPAPGIKIHAEIEIDGQSSGMQMIAPDRGELQLLP